jgi:hypothetical protein
MSTAESLLGRNRRRKVAIPILCARAAAMVGQNIESCTYVHMYICRYIKVCLHQQRNCIGLCHAAQSDTN